MSSHAAQVEARPLARRLALPRVDAVAPATLAFGALLAAVALEGNGGLQLRSLTTVELLLEALAAIAGAVAIVAAPVRRLYGGLALALFAGLLAYTAASITWAVDADGAFIEAGRTLAWLATFALGVALVRTWPDGWAALIGGLVVAALIVCGYAVLTKIFPGALNPDETYARLREPFGYWNSVGLLSAMAAPACLWLGARRSGHAALNALAYPALGVLVVACLLAYSRGALLAMAVGCGVWFALVPLRLRGVAVLAIGGFGGVLVGLWAFGNDALSQDRVPVGDRAVAGHQLGILVLALVLILVIAGLAIGFALAERAPAAPMRRGAGVAVLACVALVPALLAAGLATSEQGFSGSISKGFDDLTNPNSRTPANDPTRLTAIGSVRARYWDEALKIWRTHELEGVGAGGYNTARTRIRQDTLNVRHAHGYAVQTLADLGLIGLAITLALLAVWLAAAARATGMDRRDALRRPFTPERIGLLTLACVVVVFGVHSFVDWTWFVPGNAVPAMLCAGWLAGRGPLLAPLEERPGLRESARSALRSPWRIGGVVAALLLGALAMWATWQPQRSVNATDAALEAVEGNRLPEARGDVARARDIDPLSTTPLYVGATVELARGDAAGARRMYEEAVHVQPSSSEPWLRLAEFELSQGRPPAALRALGPALFLDPRSATVQQTYLEASRAEAQRESDVAKEKAAARRRAARRRHK